MNWRLIEQKPYSAAMNMAIEHAVYESVANEREQPTIRFYKWLSSSVSIGAYQDYKDINLEACKKHSISVVRRMTGGRAVFHDKNDFTYSVIAPIRIFGYRIDNAYRQICSCVINALKDLGITAALENKNDIFASGKKISGNAAKAMSKGVYLQHGTLVYNIDMGLMPKTLDISEEEVREKVTSILEHKRLSQKKVYEALKSSFSLGKEITTGHISKYEMLRAEELAKTRYSNILLPAGTFTRKRGACYVERG